jgi:hypothetical protein
MARARTQKIPTIANNRWDFRSSVWISGLPTRFLASTATAAAPPATAAASTAAAPAPAAPAAESTTAPWCHRPGFVHRERSSAEALLMKLRDRILRILIRRHFYECETASPPSLPVARNTHGRDLTRFGK